MLIIKELREEAQLTQKQLAEKLSTVQRNVSNWENGVTEPDLTTVAAIADFFGVTIDELFGREKTANTVFNTADAALTYAIKRLTPAQKASLENLIKAFSLNR